MVFWLTHKDFLYLVPGQVTTLMPIFQKAIGQMSQKSSTSETQFLRIIEELRFISDKDAFAAAVGESTRAAEVAADEVFCTLFDDLDIEGFLRSSEELTEEEGRILEKIVDALNSVAKETSLHIEGKQLLDNANWKLCQELASRFLQLVDEKRSE